MSKPPAKVDRRYGVRKEVNREFASVEEFILEYVSNVSRTGVFIRTDDPLPVGTKVNLRFTVILDELETIEGQGEVVRVVKPGGKNKETAGMGVVFTELTNYSKKLIERIMVKR